ncbi:MAG: TetR/AcrR family transcriptional regulator [Pseudomonadota bacterium]
MARQQQRAEATRTQLLKAFRASFLKLGYEATTTQRILDETGLSKGAMYHHFRSKSEIMRALYEQESKRAFDRAKRRVADAGPPLVQLRDLYLAWMEEVRSPSVSKMLFEIGPAALGPQSAKRIEDSVTRPHIERLLDDAILSKEMKKCDTKLVAALLNALVGEAALYRLRTGNETAAVLRATLEAVLRSFRK